MEDQGIHDPEGTNNSSGRTHNYTKDTRSYEEVKVLARDLKSNTWWRKIRKAVETTRQSVAVQCDGASRMAKKYPL